MAGLTLIDKSKLEDLFNMDSGYVLDFNDATFAIFFNGMNINIDDPKYTIHQASQSKAKRLRGFWEIEDNFKVGEALEKLIEYAEYLKDKTEIGLTEKDNKLIADCRNIANMLTGKAVRKDTSMSSTSDFLAINFSEIDLPRLPIESQLQPVIKGRLDEAKICLENDANLAVIFMAGSILEGALLGAAQKYPQQFNMSSACPKDSKTGKVKQFNEWTLSQFITVGRDINLLGEDVQKFSHALRDFRNYIHPYAQMATGFRPDKNTAEICLQVLKAALSDLIQNKPDERKN